MSNLNHDMEFFSRKIRSLNTYQKNNAQGEGKKKTTKKMLLKLYPEMLTITHCPRDHRFKLRILLLLHYELYIFFLLKLRHSATNNVTVKCTVKRKLGYFFVQKHQNGNIL